MWSALTLVVLAKVTVTGDFQICSRNDECPTHFCVEGVCCDTDCTEQCHSCILPESVGKCTAEPAGIDRRGECGPADRCLGTCGEGGGCVGATAGTGMCSPSHCTSEHTGIGPTTCAGLGDPCPEAESFDCTPYTCEFRLGACRSSCTSDQQCARGSRCDLASNTCYEIPPQPSSSFGCRYESPAPLSATVIALSAAVGISWRRRKRLRGLRR